MRTSTTPDKTNEPDARVGGAAGDANAANPDAPQHGAPSRQIRAFEAADIPGVAKLHLKVFPEGDGPHRRTANAYATYLREVFVDGPGRGTPFHSLVCEKGGEIIGFLGVVPVRMHHGNRLIWATCCTQFGVDPDRRGLAGLLLMRRHLAGPQDLSFSDECGENVLKLWEWAGGSTIRLASFQFMRPLRPGRFALSFLRARKPLAALAVAAWPIAAAFDAVVTRLPRSHFRRVAPKSTGEQLDARTMSAMLPLLIGRRALVPAYGRDARDDLRWRLARAGHFSRRGPLHRVLVRAASGEVLGWYIAYFPARAVGEVLQVAAGPAQVGAVLDHLFHDAWRAGVDGLSGRIDPALAQGYSDAYCIFSRRGPWTVVHSRDPELVNLFHRGDVFVSRLEGEWCARFE